MNTRKYVTRISLFSLLVPTCNASQYVYLFMKQSRLRLRFHFDMYLSSFNKKYGSRVAVPLMITRKAAIYCNSLTLSRGVFQTDEIKKQLQSSGAKAIITVAEIAQTALAAAKGTLAPGAPFVVIDDGTASIPPGFVPLKVRTKTDQSVELPDEFNSNS